MMDRFALSLCVLIFASVASAGEVTVDPAGRYRLQGAEQFGCEVAKDSSNLLKFTSSSNNPSILDFETFTKKLNKRIKHLKAKRDLFKLLGKPIANLKKKIKSVKLRHKFALRCEQRELPSSPALLFFDDVGVAHSEGQSEDSAFFAAGYAHASHRLFQMYFQTWKVQGRLAEFLGPTYGSQKNPLDLVGLDIDARYKGFARWVGTNFNNLDPETISLLRAYARGVNQFISENSTALPHGFQLLGVTELEPWRAEDSILAYISLTQIFTGGGDELQTEILFQEDVAELGYEAAKNKWLHPIQDVEAAIINDLPAGADFASLGAHIPLNMTASHNYVVAGTKNSSGKPVGVFLPMLSIESRAFVESRISSPSLNARGAAIPGMPGFLVGYTPFAAWGPTALPTDGSDLFKLTVDPNSPVTAYLLDGVSKPYEMNTEVIKVKGGVDLSLTVRESFFGPVIDDSPEEFSNTPHALRHVIRAEYNPGEPVDPFRGLLGMMRAKTLDEFRDIGLRHLPYPSMHLPYITSEGEHGRIGYSPVLAMPVRASAAPMQGILPQDGSLRANDWVRILTFEERPQLTDPQDGFIVTGNNLPYVGPLYGYGGIGHTHRSDILNHSLETIFQANSVAPVEDLINLRLICTNRAPTLLRDLIHYLATNYVVPSSSAIDSARAHLDLWGGTFSYSSEPYLPLILRLQSIATVTFRPTSMALEKYNGGDQGLMHFLRTFEKDPTLAVSDEYRDEIIGWIFNTVLPETWAATTRSAHEPTNPGFGPDPDNWATYLKKSVHVGWGTYFTLPKSMDPESDIVSGDLECPSAATIRSQSGNIYTQVNVMSDPDMSMTLLAPSLDESPTSPSFANQFSNWEQSTLNLSPISSTNVRAKCPSVTPSAKICGEISFDVAVSGKF